MSQDVAAPESALAGCKGAPELLAPAGNWDCARAAVCNGADAIYFGLSFFNARMRADNFTAEELPDLVGYLHRHGVKAYVTMNTLVFTSELEEAVEQLRILERHGVDAVIVQDLGLARLARLVAPSVALHASTQMTITSPEGLAFARESLGLKRAVLARELSLRDLRMFQPSEPGALPLEVFVHGALCVAYSGQCLTSEALGQRSANRGECAQACRMPYELVVDGKTVDLGDRRYLLSPRDLATHAEIPELLDLGVTNFKIEGRLKSPEYVAAVTGVYRKAIDAAMAKKRENRITEADRYALEMTFSRGLYPGWMHGVNHQELVTARFGKKRGAFVGAVSKTGRDWVEVDRDLEVKAGDGLVFDTGGDTNAEQGGRVYAVRGRRVSFKRGHIDFARVNAGDRLWKTDDPQLNQALRKSWRGAGPARMKAPLRLVVSGGVGEPMRVRDAGTGREVESRIPLEAAERHPLTGEMLARQLGRLGDTGFELESLENRLAPGVILPVSELNRMRRELVEVLESPAGPAPAGKAQAQGVDWRRLLPDPRQGEGAAAADLALSVLCRNAEQWEAAAAFEPDTIFLEFEDVRRYREAVASHRKSGSRARLILATPRIQKPGEDGFFKVIERAGADGVLIRNLGGLHYFGGCSEFVRVGDFSLNVANPIAAGLLKAEGLAWLTVSYDLNIVQVLDLARATPPAWLEVTLHQHIPMFHMEHCVFCAFMSEGTDYTNCGRPCEKHAVQLRDRVGMLHPLAADAGCRNTLYQGKAQTGAAYFQALHDAGLRRFRVELLAEDAAGATRVLAAYRELLEGRQSGQDLRRALKADARLGVTEGPLAG